jgi:hypothetical protein
MDRRRSLIVLVAVVATAMSLLAPPASAAKTPRSAVKHANRPHLSVSSLGCDGTEDVAVLEDVHPWFPVEGEARTGADVQELREQGIGLCKIASTKMTYWRLKRHPMVVIASDQPQGFYDRLFPDGYVRFSLQRYVSEGGIVVANLADCGWWGGSWSRRPYCSGEVSWQFLGGLAHVPAYLDDVDIADPGHPIVTGVADCPSGHCGQILDVGPLEDLDGYSSSTHGYFRHLPAGTTRILQIADQNGDGRPEPVMVEYAIGHGRVIASMLTLEWQYNGGFGDRNLKLLSNLLAYAHSLV